MDHKCHNAEEIGSDINVVFKENDESPMQVLQMAGSTRSLMTTIGQRQIENLGLNDLVKDYILGNKEGTITRRW